MRLELILNVYEISQKNTQKRVFQNNIEKIKNYSVKLHIDPSVPPVAQTERRIPFALRDKVNEELKPLENEGIIEDVTGEPTPWLNPLVIVLKGEHNIRICVDMRAANKAISRTQYLTPTVDDLLVKLKGSKFFTKLDMASAFHQIELNLIKTLGLLQLFNQTLA